MDEWVEREIILFTILGFTRKLKRVIVFFYYSDTIKEFKLI